MKTTGRVNGIISNIVIVKADGACGPKRNLLRVYGRYQNDGRGHQGRRRQRLCPGFRQHPGAEDRRQGRVRGAYARSDARSGPACRATTTDLQNDLEKMDGLFIARGSITDPVDFSISRMGVRPAGEGGRQGLGRIVAGRGQGAVGEPQDHGAFHDDRQLYGQEHRCGREI